MKVILSDLECLHPTILLQNLATCSTNDFIATLLRGLSVACSRYHSTRKPNLVCNRPNEFWSFTWLTVVWNLGYRFRMYGSGVVPEGVLGRVPVCSGGTSRGLHCLRREGVVEGDLIEAVGFSGPPCLPFRQCGVFLGAV